MSSCYVFDSYADAFAVALAKEFEAPLLTGDPDIIAKAEEIGIQVLAVYVMG